MRSRYICMGCRSSVERLGDTCDECRAVDDEAVDERDDDDELSEWLAGY